MSYKSTLNILDKISECHDVEVQLWREELKERIPKAAVSLDIITVMHELS